MKFAAGFAALATLAAAAPSGAPTPLDVKLEMVGNSQVKATISNNGKNNLKIFKVGTIFDNTSTEKARVATNGKAATFEGVRLRVATHGLTESNFQRIPAGKSVEVKFDVANTHDLSSGGKFDIFSSGVLQFAEETGTKLVGSVPYHSNILNTHVDGPAAAAIRNARIAKRTAIQSDCDGERGDAVIAAEKNCVDLSNAAAEVAKSGPAEKVEEFFKDSSEEVRGQIADVLTKVAGECSSTDGGASQTFCTDANNDCADRVLAYTIPSQSTITYCDLFFNDLPGLTSECHAQDQATTVLHETTHLSEIAGTEDLGYGYDNIQKLSTQDSLNNADSYAVFANSIYAKC